MIDLVNVLQAFVISLFVVATAAFVQALANGLDKSVLLVSLVLLAATLAIVYFTGKDRLVR